MDQGWIFLAQILTFLICLLECYRAGVAKVRPAGRMRASKDFLRPLCQILDAQLSYL
jgi:hypothetical protein